MSTEPAFKKQTKELSAEEGGGFNGQGLLGGHSINSRVERMRRSFVLASP